MGREELRGFGRLGNALISPKSLGRQSAGNREGKGREGTAAASSSYTASLQCPAELS